MGCKLCPRECGAEREVVKGVCGVSGDSVRVAKYMLHMWEEPCISGNKGSGAIFFAGCPLHCAYCQNKAISGGETGEDYSIDELADIMIRLQSMGAANINLVTPTHYSKQIVGAIDMARMRGLSLPIVYNCGGYESIDAIRRLEGYIDVYLTDFKYMDETLARELSYAKDYPEIAESALIEMYAQMLKREQVFSFDADGYMLNGIIVRNLLLPGAVRNSKAVVDRVYELCGDDIFISIMSQYTPMGEIKGYPQLSRTVTRREYNRLVEYVMNKDIKNAFIQEGKVASESFIPDFNALT